MVGREQNYIKDDDVIDLICFAKPLNSWQARVSNVNMTELLVDPSGVGRDGSQSTKESISWHAVR